MAVGVVKGGCGYTDTAGWKPAASLLVPWVGASWNDGLGVDPEFGCTCGRSKLILGNWAGTIALLPEGFAHLRSEFWELKGQGSGRRALEKMHERR